MKIVSLPMDKRTEISVRITNLALRIPQINGEYSTTNNRKEAIKQLKELRDSVESIKPETEHEKYLIKEALTAITTSTNYITTH